ncbi:hypothetical protein LTR51_008180 [Lithohypha guttulata]|nr:hypothetical protein LTR51_008180 [Lithohypha guttulata]
MRTTTALAARMSKLLANLHPPSPLTAQEGQRLLNVLQTSFKKELDAHHPNPRQFVQEDHAIPTGNLSTSSYATSAHFGSILSHSILGNLEGLQTKQDALRKFDQLVAESRIDTARLTSLMKWYNQAVQGDGGVVSSERLGDKLNTWLLSTNHTAREQFFLDGHSLGIAIAMLNHEKNESILWNWLRTVYERQTIDASLQSKQWLHVEDILVSALMRLAISHNDLNEATAQFNQACAYRLSSGRADPRLQSNSSAEHNVPMISAGRRLASAIIYHRLNHGIDVDLFSTALECLPSWLIDPATSKAFCTLYHPSQPSAKPLYRHLKTESQAALLVQRQEKASPTSRKTVMTALLDASKLQLEQGKRAQASFLLDFAIDHYPDFLPPREKKEVEPQLELSFTFAPGI